MPSLPKFVGPSEGRVVAVVGDAYRLLVTGDETGGAFALAEFLAPPEGGPPPHIHYREDETFYVIEGEMTFYIDGRPLNAGPGSTVRAVREVPHSFRNESDRPVRAILLITPAGFEQFLLEVGTPLPSLSDPPPAPTQADIERLITIAPKYGIEIFPPPPGTVAPRPR